MQNNNYIERKNVIDQLLLLCRLKNPELKHSQTVKHVGLKDKNDVPRIQDFVHQVDQKGKNLNNLYFLRVFTYDKMEIN